MRKLIALAAVTVLGLGGTLALVGAEEKTAAEPKHKIKDVMKTCMKGGLCGKVASGKGTEADAKKLLDMFTSLSENKPPRGDDESWKEKTSALVEAAQAAVDKKDDAGKLLKGAANCKACHDNHKGKEKK